MEMIKDLGMQNDSWDKRYNTWSRKHYGLFKCPICGREYSLPIVRGNKFKCCKHCTGKMYSQTHNLSKSKQYSVWRSMNQRCYNPNNPKYPIYGGVGITVCDKWKTFDGWWEDNKDLYKEGLTIDRIDPTKGYCPENVRWVSLSENSSQTRKRKPVNQYSIPKSFLNRSLFMKTWDSAQQAGEHLGIIPHSITRCCRHKLKSAGGFYWEYAREEDRKEVENI